MGSRCEECGKEKMPAGSFCKSCIAIFVKEKDKAHAKEQKRLKETIKCHACGMSVTRKEQEQYIGSRPLKEFGNELICEGCLMSQSRCVVCGMKVRQGLPDISGGLTIQSGLCISCKAHGNEIISRFR